LGAGDEGCETGDGEGWRARLAPAPLWRANFFGRGCKVFGGIPVCGIPVYRKSEDLFAMESWRCRGRGWVAGRATSARWARSGQGGDIVIARRGERRETTEAGGRATVMPARRAAAGPRPVRCRNEGGANSTGRGVAGGRGTPGLAPSRHGCLARGGAVGPAQPCRRGRLSLRGLHHRRRARLRCLNADLQPEWAHRCPVHP